MKKIYYLFLLSVLFVFVSCNKKKTIEQNDINNQNEIISDTQNYESDNEIKNNSTDVDNNIDNDDIQNINNIQKFYYTGDDEYLSILTEYMVDNNYFPDSDAIQIPSPVIVKFDDSDKKNIKMYGSFNLFGYKLEGDTFITENSSTDPGCAIFWIDTNDELQLVDIYVADSGSNNYESLLEICDGDEELTKNVFSACDSSTSEYISARKQYIKMYSDEYNLDIKYYKDYGWRRVAIDGDISEDENSFYDAKEIVDDMFYREIKDHFSITEDYENRIVNIEMWRDGIAELTKIDKGSDKYAEFMDVWRDLKLGIVQNGASILEIFDEHEVRDVTIVIDFVSDIDYETVLISARNGVIVYDILED